MSTELKASVYFCPLKIQDGPHSALIYKPSHGERRDAWGGWIEAKGGSYETQAAPPAGGTKGNRKLSLFICKTDVTWAKKRFLSGVCSVICCHSHFAYVGEGLLAAIVPLQRFSQGNVYVWLRIVNVSHFHRFYICFKFSN